MTRKELGSLLLRLIPIGFMVGYFLLAVLRR